MKPAPYRVASDEQLKETIAKVEDALAALRKLAAAEEDPDVEAH